MNYKNFSEMIKNTFSVGLISSVILQKSNKLFVFGTFDMYLKDGMWIVENDFIHNEFSTAKIALAWCIARKSQENDLANEIVILDYKMINNRKDTDFYLLRAEKAPDIVEKEIARHRLVEAIARNNILKAEMKKCIEMAKYMKL